MRSSYSYGSYDRSLWWATVVAVVALLVYAANQSSIPPEEPAVKKSAKRTILIQTIDGKFLEVEIDVEVGD